jgi:nitrogen fixation NifU-like protein
VNGLPAGRAVPDEADTGRRPGTPGYSDVIRERWRRPRRRGALADATAVAEDVNPLCGDRVRMMLRVADGRVAEVRFIGDSCAICTASADVSAELMEGQPVAAGPPAVPAVLEVLGADIRPARMQCVRLPLAVLARALEAAAP